MSLSPPRRPALVAILNITPDSFSDGGRYPTATAALDRMRRLLDDGASVLDLGAESTRPLAEPVSPAEEARRLLPVLEHLDRIRAHAPCRISLDTRHAATARLGIQAGVDWINDVSGCDDPAMPEVLRGAPQTQYVLMHGLGIPPRPDQVLPEGADAADLVTAWLAAALARLEDAGIGRGRVILDPGFGFGKTRAQNWQILRDFNRLVALGLPVLAGVSRKRMLADAAGAPPAAERDPETAAAGLAAAEAGAAYLRVHDVALQARLLRVWESLGRL